MALQQLAALLALTLLRNAWGIAQKTSINTTCSWFTPACPTCSIWHAPRNHPQDHGPPPTDPEQEPADLPKRKAPVCWTVKALGAEVWNYESKGHIFNVRHADACCLRQEYVEAEAAAIVSFTPNKENKTFSFCECEGIDPLKPDTFCAGTTASDFVCEVDATDTAAPVCADTSALYDHPEGCDGDLPEEPEPQPQWVALDNVSMDRACRHSTPYDLSESYYGKHFCTTTTEECKQHCASTVGCKGMEFTPSSGRCETWYTDIGATYPVFGVECLRYENPPNTPLPSMDFSLHSDGVNRACRGASSSDNSVCYYSVHNNGNLVPALTLEECKDRCRSMDGCKGIEYKLSAGYCEAWKVDIDATASVSGYDCYLAADSSRTFLP